MNKNSDLDRIVYFLDGWVTRKDTYRNFIKHIAQYHLNNYMISNFETQYDIFKTQYEPYETILISSHETYEKADNHLLKILEFEAYNGDISTYMNIHHWETREEIPDFLNKGKHLD